MTWSHRSRQARQFPRTRELTGNNLRMTGCNLSQGPKKPSHPDVMQLVPHLVLPVELLWSRWGTHHFRTCSHYEEEDLIGSKIKKSSRERQGEGSKKKVPSVTFDRWDLGMNQPVGAQRSIRAGCSMSFLISARKAAPTAPSTTRWSHESPRFMRRPGTIWPFLTTGFSMAAPTERMAA